MSPNPVAEVHRLTQEGQPDEAVALAQRALTDIEGEARGRLLIALSRAANACGRLQDALRAATEARQLMENLDSRQGVCDALLAMANVLRAAGDHHSALDSLEVAEALARELREPLRISRVLRIMGVCSSILGRHRHALSCLTDALELARAHGTADDEHNMLLSLYNAHNRQGEALPRGSEQALALLAPYIEPWQALADASGQTGNTQVQMMALGNRAITLQRCNRAAEAVPLLLELIPRYEAMGLRPNVAIAHVELGRCHEALDDPTQAREQYSVAIEQLRQDGSLDDLLDALDGLSRSEEALGNAAAALAALREVRQVEARKSDESARAAVARRELRIELARLSNQWAQQAMEDPLTGLGNRRALERWLSQQQPRTERGEPLSLLLMDLDHFKQINDHFGHDTGDEVLRRVAGLIRRHCRGGDLAARYGGEEFLLALAGVPQAEVLAIGERLRQSLADTDWRAVRDGLHVTVSIGIVHAAEAADSGALLTLADQRLYRAKIEGRNRVVGG